MKRWPIVLLSVIAAITVLIVWAVRWWNIKPVISVNYASLLNDMRKPANYDPNKDGWLVMEQAIEVLENAEHIRVLGPGDKPIHDSFRTYLHLTAQWPGDVNAPELAKLRQWMARNSDALDLVKKAECMEQFWPKWQEQDGPLCAMIWRPADGLANGSRGLLWRGKMAVWEGHLEQGLEDIFAVGMMGRCFGPKPIWIERLVSAAYVSMSCNAVTDVLARVRLTSDQLAAIAGRTETMAAGNHMSDTGISDHLLYIQDVVQRFFSDRGRGGGRLLVRCIYDDSVNRRTYLKYPWTGERLPEGFAMIQAARFSLRTERRKATLKRSEELLRLLNRLQETPPYKPEYLHVKKEYEQSRQANPFLQLFFTGEATEEFRTVMTLHRQANRLQGLRTVVAILRYKADKGKLPEILPALVEGKYLTELAIDRFSGQPFVYRVTGDDFALYSVGENGKDDGGTRKDNLDDVFWPSEL